MPWAGYHIYWNESRQQASFRVVKERVMPITTDYGRGILVLNYGSYSRVRFDIELYDPREFENAFNRLVDEGALNRWEREDWDPRTDARDRVRQARERSERGGSVVWSTRFGNVEIPFSPNLWETELSDEELVNQFELLLTHVIGRCTSAFMNAFDTPPSSEWLASVMIHLFLNSIGCTGPDMGFEPAARLTPPL